MSTEYGWGRALLIVLDMIIVVLMVSLLVKGIIEGNWWLGVVGAGLSVYAVWSFWVDWVYARQENP